MSRPPSIVVHRQQRKLKEIDHDKLCEDIRTSPLLLNPSSCLNTLVQQYNFCLGNLLDKHAPVVERKIILRPHAPWYNDQLRSEKRLKRIEERKWKKSNSNADKQSYLHTCRAYALQLTEAKKRYHINRFQDCDQHKLFHLVNELTSPCHDQVLPSHAEPKALAEEFAEFFRDKIQKVNDQISLNVDTSPHVSAVHPPTTSSLENWNVLTSDDIMQVVMASRTRSCDLDPLPTSLLKTHINELIMCITSIINTSFSTGQFPSHLKHAIITPIIKKPKLDLNLLSNYRPISNISFLSKVLEKIACIQLQKYLVDNKLLGQYQSAYRANHSTETALVRVHNDLIRAIDVGREVLLVLLDYSAAFDTVNHSILLHRLKSTYGISGKVITWIQSYLVSRTYAVKVRSISSSSCNLSCGVPQGSVIGPLLFILYTAPLESLINSHGLKCMFYADDTQLYLDFTPRNRLNAMSKISSCLKEIQTWSSANNLLLNIKKTELIHITSRFRKSLKLQPSPLLQLKPSLEVRNLGVYMDSHLRMNTNINAICRSSIIGIRKIGHIRRFLDRETTVRLVHAFITSRLDYCNSLHVALPKILLSKLQRLQNSAARLVCLTKRRDHITPILQELHWLPVKERVNFKILLLTYKSLHGLAPRYINDLLIPHTSSRNLRSLSQNRLVPAKVNTISYGHRALSYAAPSLWNSLPDRIKNAQSVTIFKSLLKTYLFTTAYRY